jgi:hypothetical protein
VAVPVAVLSYRLLLQRLFKRAEASEPALK